MNMRLNQFLAKYLNLSRRQADVFIEECFVKVNNKVAVLGQQVDLAVDTISYNGKIIKTESVQDQLFLFYKPICCVSSHKDPQDRRTIYDFLPKHLQNLKSAGRLDFMSEGLMVLSNNGNWLQDLSHPSNSKTKSYLVALSSTLTQNNMNQAKNGGIEIDSYQLQPVKISKQENMKKYDYLKPDMRLNWYRFDLQEGRNNQIRKMCDFFEVRVSRLIRIEQGEYKLTKELFDQKILEVKITQ
jgi:23S rRNA pseudouridine2605 synthase